MPSRSTITDEMSTGNGKCRHRAGMRIRTRSRNHGAHPVTFLSVARAYIDLRPYAAAGEQRKNDVRPRTKFTIPDNNGY